MKRVQENPMTFSLLVRDKSQGLQMLPLSHIGSDGFDSALICVMDPSSSPHHPGWPIRCGLNFLDKFCQHLDWPIRNLFAALVHSHSALLQRGVRVVALRMIAKEGRITAAHSPLISVQLQGVFLEIYF